MRNRVILTILLVLFSAAPVLALSGTVLDEGQRPLEGATACLLADGKPLLCDDTDANGYYSLPDAGVKSVRVVKTGYVPAMLAAVAQEAPIVLRRAAALHVTVVDAASGRPVGAGRLVVTYSSGRTLDDFPFNQAGVRIATIEPGTVKLRAELDGYRSESVDATLRAGELATVEIKVHERK